MQGMKNTKIWAVVLIVLAIVIVGYVFLTMHPGSVDYASLPRNDIAAGSTTTPSQSNQAPTATATKKDSAAFLARDGVYVIQYTNNGFVPRSIQIPQGKSIRFINMSTHGMRIFSDNMTDPKLAELNQSKTVGNGGTYTFSFVYSGVWAFHNEVQPSDSGNVVVY